MASETPTMEMPNSMLLQILAICPLPVSPQCTRFLPMVPSTGLQRCTASSLPPSMKVSVAFAAPTIPINTTKLLVGRMCLWLSMDVNASVTPCYTPSYTGWLKRNLHPLLNFFTLAHIFIRLVNIAMNNCDLGHIYSIM